MTKMASYITSSSLSGGKRQICFSKISLDEERTECIDSVYEPPFSQSEHKIVGYCKGLFCLEYGNGKSLLWNPVKDEFKFLPPSILKTPLCPSPNCPVINCTVRSATAIRGLGFDPKSGDYKVVRLAATFYDHSRDCHCFKQVEVYSLLHDSWEEVDHEGDEYDIMDECATYLDGVGYWIGTHHSEEIREIIISFDFSTHQFSSLSLPRIGGFSFRGYGYVLTNYEKSLAFMLYKRKLRTDLYGESFKTLCFWVLGTRGEWIIRMNFKFCEVERPLGLCGDFMLYEDADGELVVYDDSHGTLFKEIDDDSPVSRRLDDSDLTLFRKIKGIHDYSHSMRLFPFFKSKVLLKPSKKKKRKSMMPPKGKGGEEGDDEED